MKTLTLAALCLLIPFTAHAFDVTLAWDPNTETDLAGYRVYQADRMPSKTGPWTRIQTVLVPIVTTVITVPTGSNFAWYVTAYDTSGNESQASNVVERHDRQPPGRPHGLQKPGP